jgi:hypothetical protein
MPKPIPPEYDLNRVAIWRLMNYFIASLVPFQVASRYFYVHFAFAHWGTFEPLKLIDWWFLALGVLSLFVALSYSWRQIKVGTILGVALCIGGIGFSGLATYVFAKKIQVHWSGWVITIGCLSPAVLYLLQLRFLLTKYRKGQIGA